MKNPTLVICLLVFAALTAGACSTHQEGAAPVVESGKATAVVDECGSYVPDVDLPASRCERDEDCAWTPLRPGDCSAPLCSGHYRAGTKAWVAALEAMHARVCGDGRWRACERVKCLHIKPDGARCVDGACEPVFPERL